MFGQRLHHGRSPTPVRLQARFMIAERTALAAHQVADLRAQMTHVVVVVLLFLGGVVDLHFRTLVDEVEALESTCEMLLAEWYCSPSPFARELRREAVKMAAVACLSLPRYREVRPTARGSHALVERGK